MPKKKALLIAYGGGHINLLIPIYRELKLRNYDTVVIGLTTACEALQREAIPYLSFKDFICESDNEALLLGEKIADGITLNSKIPYEESIAYLGICYKELLDEYGEARAYSLFEHEGRQSFMPRKYMRRILKRIRPDFVVTTTSPRAEEAMVYAASDLAIPSYCIVDFGYDREASERLGVANYTNKIFVPFEVVKDLLVKFGRKSKEIEVVGNPAFDFLNTFSVEESGKAFRDKMCWKDKFVILWVKSVFDQVQQIEADVEKALVEAFSANKKTQLVFRPHPNDTRNYSDLHPSVYLSHSDDSVRSVIAASDVVVTVNSTVGLEANLMGKAVLQIDMLDYPAKVSFAELGIGDEVRCIKSVVKYLQGKISSSRQQIIKPCFEVSRCSQKIVDSIEADLT